MKKSGLKIKSPPFLAFFIALMCIVLLEATLNEYNPLHTPSYMRSQLLHMAYHKPIRPERMAAVAKFDTLVGMQQDIVQIGDSSGMVSVQPKLLAPYLPRGWSYLNASLQVPVQIQGIEALGEQILNEDHNAKVLVAIFSIFNFANHDPGFGDAVAFEYNSPWKVLLTLPSLSYREAILRYSYYWGSNAYSPNDALAGLEDRILQDQGWLPGFTKTPFVGQKCGINTYDYSLAKKRLQGLVELATRHHVRLMFMFGPVRCNADDSTAQILKDFEVFKKEHPEIIFPMPLYHQIPADYMADEPHTTLEGSAYFTQQWGEALKKALTELPYADHP